jgi:hypothetical protein
VDEVDAERLRAAAAVVRFWERVAPFLDDDTIQLASAAADVAEVLPDGWTSELWPDGTPYCHPTGPLVDGYMSRSFVVRLRGRRRFEWKAWVMEEDERSGFADTPADAARAALAALSGDPK